MGTVPQNFSQQVFQDSLMGQEASVPSAPAGVSNSSIDAIVGKLTMSGHELQAPAMKEIPSFQPAQGNNREVVGKKAQMIKGLENAFTGVANAVGQITNAEAQKKQLAVATDTQTLLKAQQGKDQAMQILKQDPKNTEALAQLKQNTDIMNGILSDPKMRKSIGKGFSIDWTNPDKQNTDDHKGVAMGKQMAQKGIRSEGDYASQFGAALPKTTQIDPIKQAGLQAAQEQRKQDLEVRKQDLEYAKVGLEVVSREKVAQLGLDGEKITALGKLALEAQQASNAWDRLKEEGKQKLQGEQERGRVDAQNILLKGAQDRLTDAVRSASPDEIFSNFTKFSDVYAQRTGDIVKQRAELTKQIKEEKDQGRIQELWARDGEMAKQQSQLDSLYQAQMGVAQKTLGFSGSTLDLSTVHVGAGQSPAPPMATSHTPSAQPVASHTPTSGGSSNGQPSGSNSGSPDTNPLTGKPWAHHTPDVEKSLIRGLYGAGQANQRFESLVSDFNRAGGQLGRAVTYPTREIFGAVGKTNEFLDEQLSGDTKD